MFLGKSQKNHVGIRDLFVVNRDIRYHDSRQKITNRGFFFVRMALIYKKDQRVNILRNTRALDT